ncbi:hypothetical protein [Azospirillum canadense]|uniref:hypothetical protein n=1 Tax=Azospirillum canadense TaxID=403962 RepID=UPI002226BCEF|nr:hypothetical protein [Azospirillum canadense]MCW2235746.1 hypothetical protein [Azospirillum canadense]
MSISSVTSSSVGGVAQQRPQGPGKEIREGVNQLKKAIESGDLESVQGAYDSLSKLASSKQSSSTSATSGTLESKDPLSKMLSAVGEALKTGDVSQVQQAFEANGPKGRGGPGGPGGGGRPMGPPPDGGQGGPPDEVKSAMGSLAQSLQSGDLSAAQDSFSSLAQLLGTDSDSSNSSTSSTSTASSPQDLFKTMLSSLSTALQSGDLSGAQKAFSSMAPRGSQGVDLYA